VCLLSSSFIAGLILLLSLCCELTSKMSYFVSSGNSGVPSCQRLNHKELNEGCALKINK
jgi:hypothetical protein